MAWCMAGSLIGLGDAPEFVGGLSYRSATSLPPTAASLLASSAAMDGARQLTNNSRANSSQTSNTKGSLRSSKHRHPVFIFIFSTLSLASILCSLYSGNSKSTISWRCHGYDIAAFNKAPLLPPQAPLCFEQPSAPISKLPKWTAHRMASESFYQRPLRERDGATRRLQRPKRRAAAMMSRRSGAQALPVAAPQAPQPVIETPTRSTGVSTATRRLIQLVLTRIRIRKFLTFFETSSHSTDLRIRPAFQVAVSIRVFSSWRPRKPSVTLATAPLCGLRSTS